MNRGTFLITFKSHPTCNTVNEPTTISQVYICIFVSFLYVHTPECVHLRRPYQGHLECQYNSLDDLQSCVASCPKGYAFTGPVFDVYQCGRATDYMWPHQSPDNPRCVIPACTGRKGLAELACTAEVPNPSLRLPMN